MRPFARWSLAAALTLLAAADGRALAADAPVKVACVGASTTSGDGSSAGHHYPDELQRLLGPGYAVTNFGVSGTTMLMAPAASYWKTPMLAKAEASLPQIAIFWFGGNDAKPENWTTHKGEFLGDYEAMVRQFQALPSHPRTFAILSLVTHDTEGIPKAVVDNEVIPLVRQAAAETGSGVVDVHGALADHPEYFPDGIHPNDMGTVAVAKLVYAALTAPATADGGASADGAAGAAETPVEAALDAAVEEAAAGAAGGPADGGAAGAAGAPGGSDAGPSPPAVDAGPAPPAVDAGAGPHGSSTGSTGAGCACSLRIDDRSRLGELLATFGLLATVLLRARRRNRSMTKEMR